MSETFEKIMARPVSERLALLVERYSELDEFTGCRAPREACEMNQIAQAVMPELIRVWRRRADLAQAEAAEKTTIKAITEMFEDGRDPNEDPALAMLCGANSAIRWMLGMHDGRFKKVLAGLRESQAFESN